MKNTLLTAEQWDELWKLSFTDSKLAKSILQAILKDYDVTCYDKLDKAIIVGPVLNLNNIDLLITIFFDNKIEGWPKEISLYKDEYMFGKMRVFTRDTWIIHLIEKGHGVINPIEYYITPNGKFLYKKIYTGILSNYTKKVKNYVIDIDEMVMSRASPYAFIYNKEIDQITEEVWEKYASKIKNRIDL